MRRLLFMDLARIIGRFMNKFEQSGMKRIGISDSIVFFAFSVLESDLQAARTFFANEEGIDILP